MEMDEGSFSGERSHVGCFCVFFWVVDLFLSFLDLLDLLGCFFAEGDRISVG